MANWLARIFGSRNQRLVSQYSGIVRQVNAFEPALQALSDADLADKTRQFREQLANGKTVDDILPEAFAAVREASRRTLGLRHFDVQLIGGMVLHDGKISEMRTGEGKTLVATLAAYLNALPGTGTHIVTVNEYLASRDAEWMGPIYRFLGLTVGVVQAGTVDRGEARRLLRGHHLQHQQRARLRLPPRQSRVPARGPHAAGRSTSRSWTKWTRS